MFRLSHEFTFQGIHSVSATHVTVLCPLEPHVHNFTGQLLFKNSVLNEYGTLRTENDLKRFADVLNSLNSMPEAWSLELIAKELYNHGVRMFPDLHGILLYLTELPFRVVEYTTDENEVQDFSQTLLKNDDSPIN